MTFLLVVFGKAVGKKVFLTDCAWPVGNFRSFSRHFSSVLELCSKKKRSVCGRFGKAVGKKVFLTGRAWPINDLLSFANPDRSLIRSEGSLTD